MFWTPIWWSEYLETLLFFIASVGLLYVYIHPVEDAISPSIENSHHARRATRVPKIWGAIALPRRRSFDPPVQPLDVEWNANFRYPSISSGTEIRLLDILKVDGDLIEAKLLQLSIDTLDGVDYHALSYTWGEDPTGNGELRFISIEGNRFCVRRNLFEFLLSWATDHEDSGGKGRPLLFVDAVCIDQHDENEKAQQVQCMRDVYGRAQRVVIWIDTVEDSSVDCTKLDADARMRERGDEDKALAMSVLFNHVYWSRTWIVQEVLLARALVLRSVGKTGHHKTVDLDKFIRLNFNSVNAMGLSHEKWLKSERKASATSLNWGRALEIIKMRQAWGPSLGQLAGLPPQTQRTLTIRDIMRLGSIQECKIVADSVYGFLGLLDTKNYPISPDYSKSNKDIYVEVLLLFTVYVYATQWANPQSLMAEFESGSKDLRRALGIDKEDNDCHDVTRLLLQLRRIPLRNSTWHNPSTRRTLFESYGNFSKPYQDKAFQLPADKGITPFIKYLDQQWQYLRHNHTMRAPPPVARTVGDVLGKHSL